MEIGEVTAIFWTINNPPILHGLEHLTLTCQNVNWSAHVSKSQGHARMLPAAEDWQICSDQHVQVFEIPDDISRERFPRGLR